MRHPITDVALLAYIARKKADVLSYSEVSKALKSSSSASRALHQLIKEGLIEPKPKLIGLRYVTQYSVTQRGRQVADLALQLSELRERVDKEKSNVPRKGRAKKNQKMRVKRAEDSPGVEEVRAGPV